MVKKHCSKANSCEEKVLLKNHLSFTFILSLRDFALGDMDLAANELSIYDKLSETVNLVRQTGHQCGMSEKAIEKFIRQLLEKNEPQRRPPQYPLLIAVYKVKLCSDLEKLRWSLDSLSFSSYTTVDWFHHWTLVFLWINWPRYHVLLGNLILVICPWWNLCLYI